jgi:hypothetical protein
MFRFKPIKVLAVGVATFFVGIVWGYFDFRRQEQILATYPDWQFWPGPMPVMARILILSGALIFILGILIAVFRLLDGLHSRS